MRRYGVWVRLRGWVRWGLAAAWVAGALVTVMDAWWFNGRGWKGLEPAGWVLALWVGIPPTVSVAVGWALRRHEPDTPTVVSQIERCHVGLVPQPADCFLDREAARRLEQAAGEGGTVVLAGMGGVGKTQLAAAYARHAWEQGVEVLVWVAAASRPAVIAGYADAAVRLGLADGDDPVQAAEAFLSCAETTDRRWLVVLDDIQNPADVRGLWPPASPPGRVVATTRLRHSALTGSGRRLVEIDVFNPSEARAYLAAKLADHASEDDQLDALAADLGRLPLALAQATAVILDEDLNVTTYRKRLQSRLLAHAAPETDGLPDDHQRIVSATWDLSIDQADKARPAGLARPLLFLASVLDPNGIPANVLTSAPAREYLASHLPNLPAEMTAVKTGLVDEALRVLHRFSLIDHDRHATHREIRIHQLIQRATRESLTPDQYTALAHAAADALMDVWPTIERGQLGVTLRANTTVLRQATGTALWQWNDRAHPVLFHAATSLGEVGQVIAAVAEFAYLHQTSHHTLGPDHHDTLAIRSHLAKWRGEAGDAAGAAAVFEELLEDHLRMLGADHPDTLAIRGSLASWRGEAGDAAGAAAATEEVLDERLRALGADHPETLIARNNLAYWRGHAGDAAGAAAASEELLADYLRVLGPDHPQTLIARNNLAYWRRHAGDAAGAAAASEELLADYLRVLGPDHPDTLAARNNLASWRGDAGDAPGAAAAFEDLLVDQLRVLGADHPKTLATRNNLALWRGHTGDAAGAAIAFEELLADCIRILGPDHPTTKTVRRNVASYNADNGDSRGC